MATDILMALLKRAISLRGDLKVAIMSATLDAAKFQTFFGGAKSLEVPGCTFPVDVHYLEGATPHYGVCALRTVKHIPKNMGPGDILVFLPSVNEVEEFCSEAKNSVHGLEIFSLYAAMASENQSRVFARSQSGSRKCTVATNIAETSVTIDGIVYVVGRSLSAIFEPQETQLTANPRHGSSEASRLQPTANRNYCDSLLSPAGV